MKKVLLFVNTLGLYWSQVPLHCWPMHCCRVCLSLLCRHTHILPWVMSLCIYSCILHSFVNVHMFYDSQHCIQMRYKVTALLAKSTYILNKMFIKTWVLLRYLLLLPKMKHSLIWISLMYVHIRLNIDKFYRQFY